MKKIEFIERVWASFDVRERTPRGHVSKEWVERIMNAMEFEARQELLRGGDVPVLGMGKLRTVQRARRRGRNPRTGEDIIIPSRKAVKFFPGVVAKRLAAGG